MKTAKETRKDEGGVLESHQGLKADKVCREEDPVDDEEGQRNHSKDEGGVLEHHQGRRVDKICREQDLVEGEAGKGDTEG